MGSDARQLQTLCTLIVDCPHSTPAWTESGFVVLRNQNIKNGRLDLSAPSFTDAEHFAHRNQRAKPMAGDLVITREAPMGDVCIIPEGLECCLGQRQVLLRPNTALVNPRFLHYALQSSAVQQQIDWNEGTGSTVSNLRIPVLKSLEIPRPSRDAQEVIANALGALDDRIDLLRQTNATLEAIAQALFKSWFVNFDPVYAKAEGRDPEAMDAATAALFPSEFEKSELGLIPKGWSVERLSDLVELTYGKALKASDRVAGGIPVYGSGGVTGWHDVALVTEPTIIVGRKGSVGTIYWEDRPCHPIDTVFFVRPKAMPLTLCLQVLRSLGLEKMNTDAAVPGLNRENAYRLEVVVASTDVNDAWHEIAEPIYVAMSNNSRRCEGLSQLRDALLPRLISGKLRLPESVDAAEEALA